MNNNWCFVNLNAFGKSYPGASYAQDSTISEAYLRWIPCVGAKKRAKHKRVASNHLRLGVESNATASLSERMPAVDTATIWSSQHFEENCVICSHVRASRSDSDVQRDCAVLDSEIEQYHRSDVAPVECGEAVPIEEVLAQINGPISGYESFPSASPDKVSTTDSKVGGDESRSVSSDEEEAISNIPFAGTLQTTLTGTLQATQAGTVHTTTAKSVGSKTSLEARAIWGMERADDLEPSKSNDLRFQSSEYIDVQSMHEESNTDGLHKVVEDLAAVVRSLAAQVRGNSETIASLAAVVKEDHEALTKMCRQQDKLIKSISDTVKN